MAARQRLGGGFLADTHSPVKAVQKHSELKRHAFGNMGKPSSITKEKVSSIPKSGNKVRLGSVRYGS